MRHLLWSALFATLLAGCDSGGAYVPVSGVIKIDGAPAPDLSINTQPLGGGDTNPGSGSYGKTDAEGKYTLIVVSPPATGAAVGEHRVTITRSTRGHSEGDELKADDRGPWPQSFADGSLRLTVPEGGTDSANFDLKSDGS